MTKRKIETEPKLKLNLQANLNYSTFQAVFLEISNKIAPGKVLRFKNNVFMTKSLRKATMLRSRLKNSFKNKSYYKNWDNDKKQRNFCVKLHHQTKEKYLSDINVKSISDSKKVRKTIKPIFSNTGVSTNNTMPVENNEIHPFFISNTFISNAWLKLA